MRPYSPGGMLNALASARRGQYLATPSTHRLRRGLPGYLILFAPHAFAPQRQYLVQKPPSPLVFLLISTNFTSTPGNSASSPILKPTSFKCTSWVEPRAFTSDLSEPPTCALRPVIPSNACTLRITAAAGTELAGASCEVPSSAHGYSSLFPTVLYDPKAFITHAAWLRQAFAHCAIFPTAASRRSLGRVSVPVWLIILSDQLTILGLVSLYLTNKLMVRGLVLR